MKRPWSKPATVNTSADVSKGELLIGRSIIKPKHGTSAEWSADTVPILRRGEIGFDTDQSSYKIGDGDRAWSDLPWWAHGTSK